VTRCVLYTLINPPETQAGCRFPPILEKRDLFFVNGPLPLGEGGATAPGEGSPPHDFEQGDILWGGLPSSGAVAPPSPSGRRTSLLFSRLI
jgi:hypothetical protein